MHQGGLPFLLREIEVEMSHCRTTWPLCILRGRPAVAGLQMVDRGQRRVFDCGQAEAVFALRGRGSREEGVSTERQERGMETDVGRQRKERELRAE